MHLCKAQMHSGSFLGQLVVLCFFFFIINSVLFFHQMSDNRAMMSFTAPFYRHEAQSTHKLKPIKIDFASAARCILKTLFLYIFLSLDASQKPALTR